MSLDKFRFFVTGGGTGGHIYPAVAVANALKKNGHDIFYIGNPKNLEKNIALKEGFEFLPVDITGMPRRLGFGLLVWCAKLFWATLMSVFYILKYKPDMVFGTGGYVSAPALFAAIITRTPFAIHDCDAMPGVVSKTVAPFAKFVSCAFDISTKYFNSDNVFVNGNPIRVDFLSIDKQSARRTLGLQDKITVMVTGGSQGAKRINKAIIDALPALFSKYDLQIIHQTGKKNYEEALAYVQKVYPSYEQNGNYIIAPYFEEMYVPLRAADIAISRAGSLSISEICLCSLASILVPYPYAAADHQRKNALELKDKNAALYLEDEDCDGETLLKSLEIFLNSVEKLEKYRQNAYKLAKPSALDNLIEKIQLCVKK